MQWQTFDRLYTEEETKKVKEMLEKQGKQVKIVKRESFGSLPCWDVFIMTEKPL
jgi:hypothetical protein